MPFRARIKRAFGRSSESSSSSSQSTLTAISSRNDSSIFQPGEPMPRPKYRAPVDKKHKELLESFSFSQNFSELSRKNSMGSLISPGGTRLPSRNHSVSEPANPRRRAALTQETDIDDAFEFGDSRVRSIHIAGPKDGSSDDSSEDGSISKPMASRTARDHKIFTADDLTRAIARTTLHTPTAVAAH